MEENPYKSPVEGVRRPTEGKWPRRLRGWSHSQPLALFYLFVLTVGVLGAILLPMLNR